MVQPSCPVFVVHDDDAFRRDLIKALDEQHFTVTFAAEGDDAVAVFGTRRFSVVIVAIDVASGRGMQALEHIRGHRDGSCGVILLGDAHPDIRTYATWADETLLKPVDPSYVAQRARTYCR